MDEKRTPTNHRPARIARMRKRRRRLIWRILGWTALGCLVLGLGVGGYAAKFAYDQYSKVRHISLGAIDWDLSTTIYDRDGNLLRKLHDDEDRILVTLDQVPQHVQDAVIAIEDARFRTHIGIDPVRIVGAAINNLKGGDIQGASTITQQLAKNVVLTHDRTWERKVQEMFIAMEAEKHLTKDEVLERYLNEIFLGKQVFGIGTAAVEYFGKSVSDLTVAEGAYLAGIIHQPNWYIQDPLRGRERMELVLDAMVRNGFLSEEDAAVATAAEIDFNPYRTAVTEPDEPEVLPEPEAPEEDEFTAGSAAPAYDYSGAHYVDYVIDAMLTPEIAAQYGLPDLSEREFFRGGYKIYTAMDPELQATVETTLGRVMTPEYVANKWWKAVPELAWNPDEPAENIQAAVVSMDPRTGEVLALVGGRSHAQDRELNRATGMRRQPGSAFKPLAVYLPAIELLHVGPGTVVDDVPLRYDAQTNLMWPLNYERDYLGLIPLREALEKSRNAVAMHLLSRVGPKAGFTIASDLGIKSLDPVHDMNLAMGLGGLTHGTTLLEMTQAYATLANLGVRVDPVIITRIEDRYGQVIYEANPGRERVVHPASAYLMVDMMKGTIVRGTASYFTAGFNGWPAAGKTGTTEISQDAWFLGFTPDLVTGVWNGYDNQTEMRSLPYTGAIVPVMIWNEIMRAAVTEEPLDWLRPEGLSRVKVCARTGLLPGEACRSTRMEWFKKGYEPTRSDDEFWTEPIPVVRQTKLNEAGLPMVGSDGQPITEWRLWGPACATEPYELQRFFQRPDFARHPKAPSDPRWLPVDLELDTPPTLLCTASDRADATHGTIMMPGEEGPIYSGNHGG